MPSPHRPGPCSAVRVCPALAILSLAAPGLHAQTAPALACPDSGIVAVSTDSLGRRVVRELGSSVDTTYTISVGHRRWRWSEHAAQVAAGVRGTRPASWRACAGAWVTFREATVVLDNARGQVRVRASLEPLLEVLRRHRSPREDP